MIEISMDRRLKEIFTLHCETQIPALHPKVLVDIPFSTKENFQFEKLIDSEEDDDDDNNNNNNNNNRNNNNNNNNDPKDHKKTGKKRPRENSHGAKKEDKERSSHFKDISKKSMPDHYPRKRRKEVNYSDLGKTLKHRGDALKRDNDLRYRYYIFSGTNFIRAAHEKEKEGKLSVAKELYYNTGRFLNLVIAKAKSARIIELLKISIATCYWKVFKISREKIKKNGVKILEFFNTLVNLKSQLQSNLSKNQDKTKTNGNIKIDMNSIVSPTSFSGESPENHHAVGDVYVSERHTNSVKTYTKETNVMLKTYKLLRETKGSPLHENFEYATIEEICEFLETKTREYFAKIKH